MTQLKDGGRQPGNREERSLSASTVIARWQRNGWDEPCKSRGLRTVLWAAGGEIPPADPAAWNPTYLQSTPHPPAPDADTIRSGTKLAKLMKHVYHEGMKDIGSPHMPSVSSAELLRQFGRYRDTAQREPVTITSRGRRSLVLISAEEYDRLKRRDRQVMRVEDL